jgi:hypothetical protein
MGRFPEHSLGKGTLGYKGETAEYYESKRGLWDVARWVIAGLLIVVGAAFLVAAASPVVPVTVVSVTDDGGSGTSTVVLRAPDGSTSSVTVTYASTPEVGSTQQALELPGGRLVLGDPSLTGRIAGVVLVGIGLLIVLWAVRRIRHPRPRVTTVLAPDDAYALPPHTS